MQKWKTLASRTVHTNPYWSVIENDVIRPNGQPGKYYVAHRAHFVAVVALTDDKRVYMIRQERYATGLVGWELPEGMIDPGEDPETAARRELLEEAGIKADQIEKIGELDAEKGFTDSIGHAFVATGLTEVGSTGQEEEGIMDCRTFSMDEIKEMIRNRELHDNFTLGPLFLAQIHGHIF